MRGRGQRIYGVHIVALLQNQAENRENKPQAVGSGETRLLNSVEKANKYFQG